MIFFLFISLKTQGEQHSLQFTFTCCKYVVRYAGTEHFVVSQFNNQAGLRVSAVISVVHQCRIDPSIYLETITAALGFVTWRP